MVNAYKNTRSKLFDVSKVIYVVFLQVRAPYKVEHPSALSRIDTVFTCPKMQGIVPPMSSVKIPVSIETLLVSI
jgi:hypothetical protein